MIVNTKSILLRGYIYFYFFQGFVLIVTIMREAVEEVRCFIRDKEVNSQIYSKLSTRGEYRLLQELYYLLYFFSNY